MPIGKASRKMKSYKRDNKRQNSYYSQDEYLPKQEREYLRRKEDYYSSDFPKREDYSRDWTAHTSHHSEIHSQRRNDNYVETSTQRWEDFERDSYPSMRRDAFPTNERKHEDFRFRDPAPSSRGRDWERERNSRNLTTLGDDYKRFIQQNREKSPSVLT